MTIDDCSSLFATIRHYIFALFDTIRTIRDYSLFVIRDYSLFGLSRHPSMMEIPTQSMNTNFYPNIALGGRGNFFDTKVVASSRCSVSQGGKQRAKNRTRRRSERIYRELFCSHKPTYQDSALRLVQVAQGLVRFRTLKFISLKVRRRLPKRVIVLCQANISLGNIYIGLNEVTLQRSTNMAAVKYQKQLPLSFALETKNNYTRAQAH